MPAQKREARRNYIDLVSDESEPHQLARASGAGPSLRDYLLELVAAY